MTSDANCIEHPEWGDVLRNEDGSVKSPFQTNMVTAVGYGICCSVGLPLNFYIIYNIVTNKRTYLNRRRNILLLSRVIFASLILIEALIDIINFKFNLEENDNFCRFYVLFVSFPSILFFLNLLLSLADRYAAFYHSKWHREKVTVPFLVITAVTSNVLVSLGVNWVYVGGFAQLQCAFQKKQAFTLFGTHLIVFISCAVLQTILYFKMKKKSHKDSSIDNPMSNQPQKQTIRKKLEPIIEEIESNNIRSDHFSNTSSDDTLDGIESLPPDSIVSSSTQQQQEQPPVTMTLNEIRKLKMFPRNLAVIVTFKNEDIHPKVLHHQRPLPPPPIKISKLDKESTQFFLAGATPLLLLSLPSLLWNLWFFICIPLFREQCASFTWVVPYFRISVAAYVTYHAIAVVRSKEYFPLPEKVNTHTPKEESRRTVRIESMNVSMI